MSVLIEIMENEDGIKLGYQLVAQEGLKNIFWIE